MAVLQDFEYTQHLLLAARVLELASKVNVRDLRETQMVRARNFARKLQALGIKPEELRERTAAGFRREVAVTEVIQNCQWALHDLISPQDLTTLIRLLGVEPVLDPEALDTKPKDLGSNEVN